MQGAPHSQASMPFARRHGAYNRGTFAALAARESGVQQRAPQRAVKGGWFAVMLARGRVRRGAALSPNPQKKELRFAFFLCFVFPLSGRGKLPRSASTLRMGKEGRGRQCLQARSLRRSGRSLWNLSCNPRAGRRGALQFESTFLVLCLRTTSLKKDCPILLFVFPRSASPNQSAFEAPDFVVPPQKFR